MRHCPQGVHAFLRAYFHDKSADAAQNRPFPLAARRAEELAKLPTYYIMDLDQDMAATVAPALPSAAAIAACQWLPDAELRVYSAEFERTGFQGGLQWYASDWGIYQRPSALEAMQSKACPRCWSSASRTPEC